MAVVESLGGFWGLLPAEVEGVQRALQDGVFAPLLRARIMDTGASDRFSYRTPEIDQILGPEKAERFDRLAVRYQHWKHYLRNAACGWRTVDTIYYADNSVEVVEVATKGPRAGQRRTRLIVAPSGDICF